MIDEINGEEMLGSTGRSRAVRSRGRGGRGIGRGNKWRIIATFILPTFRITFTYFCIWIYLLVYIALPTFACY